MNPQDLPDLPEAWESASEEEIVRALLEPKRFVNPFFMAWVKTHRPDALRRYLLLWRDLGGGLGEPARRFLREGK